LGNGTVICGVDENGKLRRTEIDAEFFRQIHPFGERTGLH
jgi:hypothetical protein